MNQWIAFFENIPPAVRAGLLIGGLAFFWMLEYLVPLMRFRYRKVRHAGINLFFTFTTVIINFAFAGAIYASASWVTEHQWGILWLFSLPDWAFALGALLMLDLIGAWLVHWVQHVVPFLWRFHLIHHTDREVDTTTANRHHPGESIVRASFTLLAVWVSGAPFWMVMLYQSLSVILSQFNHANLALPPALDRALSWIIVSPNMHKVHHHYQLPLTDTNYGNIFAIWDRIFGTFVEVKNPQELVYGIDTYHTAAESDHLNPLLTIPFKPLKSAKQLGQKP